MHFENLCFCFPGWWLCDGKRIWRQRTMSIWSWSQQHSRLQWCV